MLQFTYQKQNDKNKYHPAPLAINLKCSSPVTENKNQLVRTSPIQWLHKANTPFSSTQQFSAFHYNVISIHVFPVCLVNEDSSKKLILLHANLHAFY